MPGEETFQEKTEPATPRRQQEARRKGDVAKSQELNSLLILLSGLVLLRLLGPGIFQGLSQLSRYLWRNAFGIFQGLSQLSRYLWRNAFTFPVTPSEIPIHFSRGIVQVSQFLLPVVLGIMLIGIATNLMQVGFIFSSSSLAPDLNRINPVKGLGNLFSKKALMRLLFSMLKIFIVAYIAYITVRAQLPQLLRRTDFSFSGKLRL